MSETCVACNARYDGDNHHCDKAWENKTEANRRRDYDEVQPLYGSRLSYGFYCLVGSEQ